MPPLFEHPDAAAVFEKALVSLTHESDRGALLVGAAFVDNALRGLFEAVLPDDLGKAERKQLLNYPGPLSSLAARTQIAYGLRLVPRTVYDAVNALRAMRNEVAHKPDDFVLVDNVTRVRQIYAAMGPTFPDGLRNLAAEMMLDHKAHVVLAAARKAEGGDPELALGIETKEQAIAFIVESTDTHDALRVQRLRWELAIGVSALCGLIIMARERARAVLGSSGTVWSVTHNRSTDPNTVTEGEPPPATPHAAA